ncbi:hypothetical protein BX666DRAFT_571688 [Dichotomocladium elegans]|nr:hypothetical protein BX666DRAFT_571688 [Dichotomocladium elegans]
MWVISLCPPPQPSLSFFFSCVSCIDLWVRSRSFFLSLSLHDYLLFCLLVLYNMFSQPFDFGSQVDLFPTVSSSPTDCNYGTVSDTPLSSSAAATASTTAAAAIQGEFAFIPVSNPLFTSVKHSPPLHTPDTVPAAFTLSAATVTASSLTFDTQHQHSIYSSQIMVPESNDLFTTVYHHQHPTSAILATSSSPVEHQHLHHHQHQHEHQDSQLPPLIFADSHMVTKQQPPQQQQHRKSSYGERAPWTPEEDNLLRLAVQLYGDRTEKWAKIAACVPGRTNKKCRKRWFHSLDPSLRKGAWTEEEDRLLREGVVRYPNQWSKIADMLVGRTDDQCAKRWRESLDPAIDRSEWSSEEDARLMELYNQYGTQWQKIAQHFEGRPGLHCRNRWRKLQRMIQLKKSSTNPSSSSLPSPPISSSSPARAIDQQPATVSIITVQPPLSTLRHGNLKSEESHGEAGSENPDDEEPHQALNPYGCDVPGCLSSFPQSTGLFYHMKQCHPDIQKYDKPYRCAMANCAKRYKNINGLQYHLREAKGALSHGRKASR